MPSVKERRRRLTALDLQLPDVVVLDMRGAPLRTADRVAWVKARQIDQYLIALGLHPDDQRCRPLAGTLVAYRNRRDALMEEARQLKEARASPARVREKVKLARSQMPIILRRLRALRRISLGED